jgi:cellulose synthase/poly-beta-1,6-N-acetylglucosamine synthase-like glycosyltransferase
MSDQNLRRFGGTPISRSSEPRKPIGSYLVDQGVITQDQLVHALERQLRVAAPLGDILIAEGWATKSDIHAGLIQQQGLQWVDLTGHQPDEEVLKLRSPQFWLRHQAIPWLRLGPMLLIATANPDHFARIREALAAECETILPVLADQDAICDLLALQFRDNLAAAASARVAPEFSCRDWIGPRRHLLPSLLVFALAICTVLAPTAIFAVASMLAILFLALFLGLKLAGMVAYLSDRTKMTTQPPPGSLSDEPGKLPKISVIVPLFKEREIAAALVRRLSQLTYPKALLDVVLVLEEHDLITRDALAQTTLPYWMRILQVPAHEGLTTKPRAMNYALDFCRGDIIGVWDAEDAPAPDQLEQVALHFRRAAPDVVCLQGILDYYNPRTNWLSRCFTIEYSSWFRIILPGIARLGLVVPLGGTTLFFKRDKLDKLGGWDAHNVTEDADLGLRLCRAGYRTELIRTVTHEEANCRPWPWIKQRSRWLKGFMVTYLVHMRNPLGLLRDLGWKRFVGVQAFFLGTLGQFLLAPIIWSFWLILIGFEHPLSAFAPTSVLVACSGLLMLFELLSLSIGIAAVTSSGRRYLLGWLPTMIFYFPIGVLAAYKALYELIWCPFYWDKTQHGQIAPPLPDEA